eukprot:scaffold1979_cov116-Isochrysis_galbana.AAC.3
MGLLFASGSAGAASSSVGAAPASMTNTAGGSTPLPHMAAMPRSAVACAAKEAAFALAAALLPFLPLGSGGSVSGTIAASDAGSTLAGSQSA